MVVPADLPMATELIGLAAADRREGESPRAIYTRVGSAALDAVDAEEHLMACLDEADARAEEWPSACYLGKVEDALDPTASAYAFATASGRLVVLVARGEPEEGSAAQALRAVHRALVEALSFPFACWGERIESPSLDAKVDAAVAGLELAEG